MIAQMDRLEIVCLRDILPDVVAYLQAEGLVHIEEAPLVSETPDYLKRCELSTDQNKAMDALDDLIRLVKEVLPLVSVKPSPSQVFEAGKAMQSQSDEELEAQARRWARELRTLTRRRLNALDNVAILTNFQKTLQAIEPLLGGRDVVLGKDARAFVLKGDYQPILDQIDSRRREVLGSDSKLVVQKIARDSVVGLILFSPDKSAAAAQLFKDEHIPPVDAPGEHLAGSGLRDVISKVQAAIATQKDNAAQLVDKQAEYSREIGAGITAYHALLSDRMSQLTAVDKLAQSNLISVCSGWAPSDEAATFIEKLNKKFPGQTMVSRLPLHEVDPHEVPTLLRNNSFFKPFEVLLSLFKPPTYGSMDPTPLVAISFIFFYGFILGDVIYGIAVILFALWLRKKLGHIPMVEAASSVGIYMGISGIFFGILFAEYAGSLGEKWLGLHPIWLHRGHDIPKLMLYAIAVGAIHIPLALILGIRTDFAHHNSKHAIEKLALLLGLMAVFLFVLNFAGVPPFSLSVTPYLCGLLLVVCFGMLVYAVGGLAPITFLEIVSLVGNVLSYCRLMALGLAAVLIAELANQLGSALGIIGIPLAILVHLFNIALAIFSPTIHSLRLNYVEFLPKFYHPEGRNYQPFKKEALWE